jgi:hypothetical protein
MQSVSAAPSLTPQGSENTEDSLPSEQKASRTTVMLCNLPQQLTRDTLLRLVDEHGFWKRYNFLNFPREFDTLRHYGYAFINLMTHEDAINFKRIFHHFAEWPVPSVKQATAHWGTHHGFEENTNRYRNSPVMRPEVPDECKPIVLQDGMRIDFPRPTRTVKAPRNRRQGRQVNRRVV